MPPKRGTPLADFRVPGFKDPTTEMPTPPSDHIPLWRRCAFRPERSPPYVWVHPDEERGLTFYRGRFAKGLSPGTDAVSAVGAAGSLADLCSINNCPATNITAANAIANIAVASWWTSFICAPGYQNTADRTLVRGIKFRVSRC